MKYRNKRDGKYASKAEARRAQELALLSKIGVITDLVEQPEYELIPKQDGERSVVYRADFQYYDNEKKQIVTEDVKGFRTKDYIIKRKLFRFRMGYPITEVK